MISKIRAEAFRRPIRSSSSTANFQEIAQDSLSTANLQALTGRQREAIKVTIKQLESTLKVQSKPQSSDQSGK